jgi:GT2 family glycosyltransferase
MFKPHARMTRLRSKLFGPYEALAIRMAQQPLLQPAVLRFWKKRRLIIGTREYQQWIRRHELRVWDPDRLRRSASELTNQPKISIVLPVYNTRRRWLERAIQSVRAQAYDNWELCVCDDASSEPYIRSCLEQWREADQRIKVVFAPENGGISRASNRALQLATGEFVGLLDHDDELAPAALYEVVKLLQRHPEADLIYSDEDKLDGSGRRCDPFFKPDWSPEYLLSCNYICHFGVYRKALVESLGGFRSQFDGSQDYDLILRVSDRSERIFHIPEVLYHWRQSSASTAQRSAAKQYCAQAGHAALQQHLERRQINGTVEYGSQAGRYRVRPTIQGNPLVSIVLRATTDGSVVRRCLRALQARTTYPNYEALIVHDGTIGLDALESPDGKVRLLRLEGTCSASRVNNLAAREARGEHLLLLDPHAEILSPDWLGSMLELCQLEGVGAVGAKLYSPHQTIGDAGIILGGGGVARFSHANLPAKSRGYFDALICTRNYSAVSYACMLVRRQAYEAAGGWDDGLSTFSDIDFCLRLRAKGWRIAWTPFAELIKHESAPGGAGGDPAEIKIMQECWGAALERDPYYNANLSLEKQTFALNLEAS